MDYYELYLNDIINTVPLYIYVYIFSFVCVSIVAVIIKCGKNRWKYVGCILLIAYIILVFCSTVFFRETADARKYNLLPFWSYRIILETNSKALMAENLMNIIFFLPIGLISGMFFPNIRWWRVLQSGMFIAITIETLQFLFNRGFAEIDDVIHNTVGCLIGWFMVKGSRFMVDG